MQARAAIRRMFNVTPDRGDVDSRQAVLLQWILLVIVIALLVSAVAALILEGLGSTFPTVRALVLLEPLFLIPLWLLRSGHFQIAATATVGVSQFVVLIAVAAAGPSAPATGAAFAIPMTIAALVLRRPGLIVVTAVSIVAILPDTSRATPDKSSVIGRNGG